MTISKLWQGAWLATAATVATTMVPAFAQTPAPAATTEAAPAAPAAADAPPAGYWVNGIHLSAQIDGGITGNFAAPKNDFGNLFSDKPNTVLLNQVLLTATKPLDPKATGFDWGFKLQGLYGSDARYTHFLGEFDRTLQNDRNQIDLVEANILFHLPVLFDGGIDIKAGQYSTPLGFETIDPSTNPFYSHSYIFNFGLPFKHTGILTTSHVSGLLDVYLGIDTGVNTSFGTGGSDPGDNNGAVAFLGGVNLTMMDGGLTVLALTHIGPENASRAWAFNKNVNGYYRYLNDVVVTYKATDALTLVTELNWIRDDAAVGTAPGKTANAFGVAQYAAYTLSDTMTLNGRAEIYRDDHNLFVSAYATNSGPDLAQQGISALGVTAAPGGSTTFGALTLGVTYKPADLPAPISGLLVRPEIRYDQALTNNKPYNGGKDSGSFTVASDVVLTF